MLNKSAPQAKVLLCGGGNAVHVLASYIGSLPEAKVCILSLYPGESERLQEAVDSSENGIQCTRNDGLPVYGKPALISNDPSEVTPDSDVIIMALPAAFHEMYLKKLKPHLKHGVLIGAMPGQSGLDLCMRHVLGEKVCSAANLFGFETLPWACRIKEYGKRVEVLGTKAEVSVSVVPCKENSVGSVIETIQHLIGPEPVLKPSGSLLVTTLANVNIVHPTISYGFYRDKNLTEPFDSPPIFYQGVDERTGDMLTKISDEVLRIRDCLSARYAGLDLSSVVHLRDFMLKCYSDYIEDKTSVTTMLQTSRAHAGLCHPVREVKVGNATKYLPDFGYRYFTEDLPCGMLVIRGIAELSGVATPVLDEVIAWCQKVMGMEFLVDGKLRGRDVGRTRCPQAYGYTDLDTFMRENHYLEVKSPEELPVAQ